MAVLVNTFAKHATDVTSCSFSPNSKVLASSSGDKSVRLWNIENGSELSVSPLLGHTYSVNSCSFSPFGTILATASTDCSVFLWDVDSGSMITVLQGHKNVVRVCRFSPNSRFLLTGSADETFCIWDVSSKKLVKCVDGLESSVLTCCFTPDSLHIVTGTSMGDLCIWDAQSGKMMKFYAEGHDLGVADCCFSPTFGSASKLRLQFFAVCVFRNKIYWGPFDTNIIDLIILSWRLCDCFRVSFEYKSFIISNWCGSNSQFCVVIYKLHNS